MVVIDSQSGSVKWTGFQTDCETALKRWGGSGADLALTMRFNLQMRAETVFKRTPNLLESTFGYNDVSIPQSRIAISKSSFYLERLTEGTGIIDSMGPNRNKEDIVISRIVTTRVDCIRKRTSIYVYINRLEIMVSVLCSSSSQMHCYYSTHDATKAQRKRRKEKLWKSSNKGQLHLLCPWNNLPSIKENEAH